MFSQETLIIRPDFEETRKDPREVVMFKQLKRPKIALILGGGGARGAAHIGAIEALEKNNVPIDLIVGSSMGSVIGGLYAMGYSTAQLRTLVDTTNWNEVLSLTDETSRTNLYMGQKETVDRTLFTLRFDGLSPILPSSVSSGQRLTNFINQLTLYGIYRPAPSFDDLKIPFRSVATDLVSGKRIVMSSGDISEALRASITVPILYSALGRDTLQLVDGGLLSNIPVDIAKSLNADIIIAVDVSSPLRSVDQMNAPWEVADQIIGIMAQLANKQSLAQATIVIKPNLNNHLAGDFSNLRPMIEKGYKATEQVMPSLHDSIRVKETAQYSSGPDASQYAFDVVTLTYREDGAFMPPPELLKVLERIPRVSVGLIKERISRLYATGEFHDVRAEIKIYGNAAAATVSLHSNPIVQEIAISGNAVIPTEEVMKPMRDLQYTRLNSKRVKNGIESLLSLYRDEGYSLARVTAAQFDTVTGTLRINLDEGIVGNISMSGNKKARDWLIRREVVLSRGDVFTVAKAQQSINNIMATNLFEQALIEIRFVDKTPTIVIKTTERRSELIRAGIRADNERGMQPSFQIRDDNFLGTATELGLSSFGGLRNRKFLFEFRANRIFNTYFTFDLNSYYDLRDIYTYRNDPSVSSDTRFKRIQSGEYRRIRYGTSLSLGRQVERLGNFAVEFRVEHNQNRFITGSDGSSDHYTLQALRLRSTVDALDHYPYASSGSLMNLFWETATSQVGGEIGYSKLFFSYEWYNTVNAHHTFHPKFTFGFADETLPLSQQFFLGGEESFFGLRENDSPGRQLFLFNLEYRYLLPFRILWETYAKVRYDFGSIWPAQSNIKIRDLHHGIGVGLGIDTPIGPANLSAGRSFYIRRDVLNEPISYGPMLFYFSVGYQL